MKFKVIFMKHKLLSFKITAKKKVMTKKEVAKTKKNR